MARAVAAGGQGAAVRWDPFWFRGLGVTPCSPLPRNRNRDTLVASCW